MRIFPDMLKQYFVLLAYVKFRMGGDFPSMYSDLYNYYRDGRVKDPTIVRALQVARLDHLDPKYTVDELIDIFKGKIAHPGEANAEGDLIDLLIEALNSPLSNNVLTGKAIGSLRKALMQPEEVVAFKERVRGYKLGCAGCGVDLEQREAISFSLSNGQPLLYCTQCQFPTTAACPGCKKKAPFSERYTSKKWKDCSSHDKGQKIVDEDAKVPKRVADEDIINWARNPLRPGRVRVQPAPAPRVPVAPPVEQFYGDDAQLNQVPQYGDGVNQAELLYNYHPQPLGFGQPQAGAAAGIGQLEIENIDLPEDDDFLPNLVDDDDEPDEGN